MNDRNPRLRARPAFTLIELLVVISIIALLIAILLPSLARSRVVSRRTQTLAHLRGLGAAMAGYQHEYRDELPTLITHEEKGFLGMSLLGRIYKFPDQLYINPNTPDSPPGKVSDDGRPVLADLDGAEITNDTMIGPGDIPLVRFHCSFSYDNDIKGEYNRGRVAVYAGDRSDYERGRTFSNNWKGEGMCLLWTDQHAEFSKRQSIPDQSDPNIYHHNEWMGEGADEVHDGVGVTEHTYDTHMRFFSEEEDDVLLPE